MEPKLGKKIASFRKAKGMTQEQLATALGISTPAVSKWETDSSYPDITLLCPLARTLGTNVDTLLQFEETISEKQIEEKINEIVETARIKDVWTADELLQKLLHQYPSSTLLKYYAAVALDTFRIFQPLVSEEQTKKWVRQKKELLQTVYTDKASAYWQSAVVNLAVMRIDEGELDAAEEMLKELPEHNSDPTMAWIQLYLKREEATKALEITQKRLYVLVSHIQSCLSSLMDEKIEPDAEKALEICEIYQKTEELFRGGTGMSEGFFLDIYRRMGQEEKMLDCLIRFVDAIIHPVPMPNPILFSTVIEKSEQEQRMYPKEMKEMMLKVLLTDELLASYRENPDFGAATERLRNHISLEI